MSKDFKLLQRCTHEVVQEWLYLDNDLQTLRPLQPPSAQATVKVYVGLAKKEIPRNGVEESATVLNRGQGPYQIVANVNDQIFVRYLGILYPVTLTVGQRVSQEQIVKDLKAALPSQYLTVSLSKSASTGMSQIAISTINTGRSQVIDFIAPRSPAGFPSRIVAQGVTHYPSWQIVRADEVDPFARKLIFNQPLKTRDMLLYMSYVTEPRFCRRCQGLNIEDDLRYDTSGNLIFVQNEELLIQEAQKAVLTQKGSNLYHKWYGSDLIKRLGAKVTTSGEYVQAQITQDIVNVLDRYKSIKDQQARLVPVTPQELLSQVVAVDVVQDSDDPTIFRVRIELRTSSNTIEVLDQAFSVPGVDTFEGFLRRA